MGRGPSAAHTRMSGRSPGLTDGVAAMVRRPPWCKCTLSGAHSLSCIHAPDGIIVQAGHHGGDKTFYEENF